MWWFAGIWLAAAAWLSLQKREGMATHAVIGLLLLGFGLAARYRELPWELIALAIAVASLALAARRSTSPRLHGFLAGLVLLLSRGAHDRRARARCARRAFLEWPVPRAAGGCGPDDRSPR